VQDHGPVRASNVATQLKEFETVELILNSSAQTRGVDAFALSLIKAERQLRRLVTHLIYQFPCFGPDHITGLRQTLGKYHNVYFDGFEKGFDALYPQNIKDLVGLAYDESRQRVHAAIQVRNKIFHGQLTDLYLTRDDLLGYITDVRAWCEALAENTSAEFGYDGFARPSFQKSETPMLWQRFKVQFTDVQSYDVFIREHMQRR
jgi:hypothetical protein